MAMLRTLVVFLFAGLSVWQAAANESLTAENIMGPRGRQPGP
jgi:hypothetical protein